MDYLTNYRNKLFVALGTLLIFSAGAFLELKHFRQAAPEAMETNRSSEASSWNGGENGLPEIHPGTGLVKAEGYLMVIAHCTACHSAQLVIQNRMNEERWNATIRWMQETQNLWDLGENQKIIVDYLIKNYPPVDHGRRQPLADIEWYDLQEN